MQTSERGLQLIREAEGLRLKAYRDSVGVATIGYGHTGRMSPPPVFANTSITRAEAEAYLLSDVKACEEIVRRNVAVPLTQGQFDALVSWVFNLGEGNLRVSTLLRKLNAGDYKGAAKEFERWVYAGEKVLPGLVTRRQAERELFERSDAFPQTGDWPKPPPRPEVPQGFWATIVAAITQWFRGFFGGK